MRTSSSSSVSCSVQSLEELAALLLCTNDSGITVGDIVNHSGFMLQEDAAVSRTFAEPAFLLYMSVLRPKFCRSTDLSFTFSGNDIIGWVAGVCWNTGQNSKPQRAPGASRENLHLRASACGPGTSSAAGAPNWRECLPARESVRWGEDPWVWAGSRSPPGS